MPAGETPYLAAKGLDGNVLQRDRPAGERVVPGKTGQADRTGGVATDVQAEPFVSAVFSRHSRKYRVVYRMLACGRVDARGQAVNTLTFQLDHSVGAGQPIAAIASRRWAPWRGVEEGQAQGVRRSEVPLVATPAGAARVAGLWVTEDRNSQQRVFLRAMLFRATFARHRIRHGIRHTRRPSDGARADVSQTAVCDTC